jgi:hypothetical protein
LKTQIVADTNLIQGRGFFHFDNDLWPVILAAVRKQIAVLLVPEVVVLELVKHYTIQVKQFLRDDRAARKALERLTVEVTLSEPPESIDIYSERYERWLRALIERHGRILPLPAVSHEQLLKDTLNERKPFSRGDGGYRDALIWHSLLETVKTSQEDVVLLSSNTKDFAEDSTSVLASDLQADLRELGVKSSVRLVTDLQSLVALLVPEDVKAGAAAVVFLRSDRGQKVLEAAFEDHFEDYRREFFTGHPEAVPPWLMMPDIEGVMAIAGIDRVIAYRLDDDKVLLTIGLRAEAYVGGFVDAKLLEIFDAGDFQVWDSLSGEQYYMAHPQPQPISISLCATWSTRQGMLSDLEFLSLFLKTRTLNPPPPFLPSSPRPDTAEGTFHWILNELRRLLGLDRLAQEHAARTETYIDELHAALEEIGTLRIMRILTPIESAALFPDNLALMLQDDLGIRGMISALEKLELSQS